MTDLYAWFQSWKGLLIKNLHTYMLMEGESILAMHCYAGARLKGFPLNTQHYTLQNTIQ